jgi:hypothetical protein
MQVKVTISASETRKSFNVSLEDLGTTDEDWAEMTDESREKLIEEYIDGFDQPYWGIDSFYEK